MYYTYVLQGTKDMEFYVELHKRGLKAEGQVPITVGYKGEVVDEYFADIVVKGK